MDKICISRDGEQARKKEMKRYATHVKNNHSEYQIYQLPFKRVSFVYLDVDVECRDSAM